MQDLFQVIFEDADLLVVNKPAGLVCHPTKGDARSSLISRARLYLGAAAPGLVNRLDRETSGIVLIAKTSATAGHLGKLIENRSVTKEYLAIVHASPPVPSIQSIDLPLGKDEASQIAIKDCVRPDGAAATTELTLVKHFERNGKTFALLRVWPMTGRKHQIRIHLAAVGHPIVGDKLYGGDEDLYLAFVQERLTDEQSRRLILANHALHARALRLTWRGVETTFEAPPEPAFTNFANP